MDEWNAPRVPEVPGVDPDVDDSAIRQGLDRARIVAVALMVTALTHAAAGLQILLFAYRPSALVWAAGLGFAGWAVAHVVVGSRVYDGGHTATLAGVGIAFCGALFAAGWWLLLVFQSTLSLIAMVVAAGGLLCGVGCLVLLPSTARIAAARRRLIDG